MLIVRRDYMRYRRRKLDELDVFQKKLADFYQKMEQEGYYKNVIDDMSKYIEVIKQYSDKGMSLTDISKAVGIPRATIHNWIKKMKEKDAEHV